MLENTSIIIPLAKGEASWRGLLADLSLWPRLGEVLFIFCEDDPKYEEIAFEIWNHFPRAAFYKSKKGRAFQLNLGAHVATKEYFWFLHADSRFTKATVPALIKSFQSDPKALHYFTLSFLPDGPKFVKINQFGCWIRSQLMKTPFGDQGFFISKENYKLIGGFPEDVRYGEDHLFVRRARQNKIQLQAVGASLKTSSRKYKEQGWWKTTYQHWFLWRQQVKSDKQRLKGL